MLVRIKVTSSVKQLTWAGNRLMFLLFLNSRHRSNIHHCSFKSHRLPIKPPIRNIVIWRCISHHFVNTGFWLVTVNDCFALLARRWLVFLLFILRHRLFPLLNMWLLLLLLRLGSEHVILFEGWFRCEMGNWLFFCLLRHEIWQCVEWSMISYITFARDWLASNIFTWRLIELLLYLLITLIIISSSSIGRILIKELLGGGSSLLSCALSPVLSFWFVKVV